MNNPKHPCTKCGRKYTAKGLRYHVEKMVCSKVMSCNKCNKKFPTNAKLKRHTDHGICSKYDEIHTFDNQSDFDQWIEKSKPISFSKASGNRNSKNFTVNYYKCNNKRIVLKNKSRAPNFTSFFKSNMVPCTGRMRVESSTDKTRVFWKKCTIKDHMIAKKIQPKVRLYILQCLFSGMSQGQVRRQVAAKFKLSISKCTVNNLKYANKINMDFRSSQNDIVSAKNFLKKFHNCHSNIEEITQMKDLVAVFQTERMNKIWDKNATLCLDSTHKISK